jgi:hypothetical protein
MTSIKNPTVFISYSHDSEEHKDWVRNFTDKLIVSGVDAKLDQYEIELTDSFPKYMERGIGDNDFVIFMITEKFVSSSKERIGGVGYEIDIATGEILTKGKRNKYIGILIGIDYHDVPEFLLGKNSIKIIDLNSYDKEFEELYGYVTGQKKYVKPPLGKIIPLETLNTKAKVSTFQIDKLLEDTNAKHFSCISVSFKLNDFSDYEVADLYPEYLKSRFINIEGPLDMEIPYPVVLRSQYQKHDNAKIIFSTENLSSVRNECLYDKLIMEKNVIDYNSILLMNHDICYLEYKHSLSSIFFLLYMLKNLIHKHEKMYSFETSVTINTSSNAILSFDSSLFPLNNRFERYKTTEKLISFNHQITSYLPDDLYRFFKKFYNIVRSENEKSANLFVDFNIESFNRIYRRSPFVAKK